MSFAKRHLETIIVSMITAAITAGAPALAAMVFDAKNADKVDGKHAVSASSSSAKRKGKLVATSPTSGRLPNNIISKAPDSSKLGGVAAAEYLRSSDAVDAATLEGKAASDFASSEVEDWTYHSNFGYGCEADTGPYYESWQNTGGPLQPFSYYKDPIGIVHLRGAVQCPLNNDGVTHGTAVNVVACLPEGYQPHGWERYQLPVEGGGSGQMIIRETGCIYPPAGGNNGFSMDGVTFRAED